MVHGIDSYHSSYHPCWWRVLQQLREPHQDRPPTMHWHLCLWLHNCCPLEVPLGPCCRRLPSMKRDSHRYSDHSRRCTWTLVGWVPRSRPDVLALCISYKSSLNHLCQYNLFTFHIDSHLRHLCGTTFRLNWTTATLINRVLNLALSHGFLSMPRPTRNRRLCELCLRGAISIYVLIDWLIDWFSEKEVKWNFTSLHFRSF